MIIAVFLNTVAFALWGVIALLTKAPLPSILAFMHGFILYLMINSVPTKK